MTSIVIRSCFTEKPYDCLDEKFYDNTGGVNMEVIDHDFDRKVISLFNHYGGIFEDHGKNLLRAYKDIFQRIYDAGAEDVEIESAVIGVLTEEGIGQWR